MRGKSQGWSLCLRFLLLHRRRCTWVRTTPKSTYMVWKTVQFWCLSALIGPKTFNCSLHISHSFGWISNHFWGKSLKMESHHFSRRGLYTSFSPKLYKFQGAIMLSEFPLVSRIFLCIFRAIVLLYQKQNEDHFWILEIALTKHLLCLLIPMPVCHKTWVILINFASLAIIQWFFLHNENPLGFAM